MPSDQCVTRSDRPWFPDGGELRVPDSDLDVVLTRDLNAATLDARQLLSRYCALFYDRFGTPEEVARRTRLDRRTVKKYLQSEMQDSGFRRASGFKK